MKFPLFANPDLYIDHSDISRAGRGVFADRAIPAGEVIEISPMLVVGNWWVAKLLRFTSLRNYYYQWGPERRIVAFALGFGSLYNHSYDPNAVYEKDIDEETITFKARRDIAKGEEVTINYNGYPDDERELWIDEVNVKEV